MKVSIVSMQSQMQIAFAKISFVMLLSGWRGKNSLDAAASSERVATGGSQLRKRADENRNEKIQLNEDIHVTRLVLENEKASFG